MTFEQKHPDVTKLYNYKDILTYTLLSESGRILESWEREDNQSPWRDVTLREQELEKARIELAKAKKEVEKLDEQV